MFVVLDSVPQLITELWEFRKDEMEMRQNVGSVILTRLQKLHFSKLNLLKEISIYRLENAHILIQVLFLVIYLKVSG